MSKGQFPNKDTQFKKGHEKLGGKQKGFKSTATVFKELLKAKSKTGEWATPLVEEKLLIIYSKDDNGDYVYNVDQRQKAIDSIIDRVEGKATQTTINENTNKEIKENDLSKLSDKELKAYDKLADKTRL